MRKSLTAATLAAAFLVPSTATWATSEQPSVLIPQEVINACHDGRSSRFITDTRCSDQRLKADIALVSRLGNGIGVYRFRYKWSSVEYVGVLAQEVAAVAPEAIVKGPAGYMKVDYAKLGFNPTTWRAWRKTNNL